MMMMMNHWGQSSSCFNGLCPTQAAFAHVTHLAPHKIEQF